MILFTAKVCRRLLEKSRDVNRPHDYVMSKEILREKKNTFNWHCALSLTFAVETGWIVWSMDLWIVFSWIVAESHVR